MAMNKRRRVTQDAANEGMSKIVKWAKDSLGPDEIQQLIEALLSENDGDEAQRSGIGQLTREG